MTKEQIIGFIKDKLATTIIGYPSKEGFKKPFHLAEKMQIALNDIPSDLPHVNSYKADSFEVGVDVINHFMAEVNKEPVDSNKFTVNRTGEIYVWFEITA